MKLEVGRVNDIGAMPGDVVECVKGEGAFTWGKKYKIRDDGRLVDDFGALWPLVGGTPPASKFKIVTDAPQPAGPVRTITRKEIVPGVYGQVVVCDEGNSCRVRYMRDAVTIRAAIATLSEIADAMEENSK